jgi:hypothetical protein
MSPVVWIEVWPSSFWTALRLPVVEHALAGGVAALVHLLAAGRARRDDAGGGEAAIPPVVRGVAAHRLLGIAAHAASRNSSMRSVPAGGRSPRSGGREVAGELVQAALVVAVAGVGQALSLRAQVAGSVPDRC